MSAISHHTMRGRFNYSALPPSSPLQLPLPYLPSPPSLQSPPPPLPLLLSPPPPPVSAFDAAFQSRISPSILLIILILAVIFFVSGLLHLLVRFILRPAPRDAGDADSGGGGEPNVTAFQGQLQQLFHLHDAGVDQSFIDTLPVFLYGAVVGAGRKDPFDCAVCLCEFADDDRLRLLPKCSHAFHVDCIDTWLLSHSTCPLCRRSLLADFSPYGSGCSPLLFVLESGSEGSVSDRFDATSSAHLSHVTEQQQEEESEPVQKTAAVEKADEVVVNVKLGKFRSQAAAAGVGGSSSMRRCYSMGTYEYVMDERSLLRVAVKPPAKRRPMTTAASQMMPGHRVAMSECDCHSKRESFRGFVQPPPMPPKMVDEKRESFSFSKIWMRGAAPRRKDVSASSAAAGAPCSSSRRAASFRLSAVLQRAASDVAAAKRRPDVVSPVTESEYNVSAWDKSEKSGSVADWDIESGGGGGLGSRADEAPSFARRTLLWIRGHL
uniref:RING-type E3 ubiquitin transferase n=1 Tax=Leersia perrieri TaxID=77586 RepID=A0A0D9X8E4_9ORYZ